MAFHSEFESFLTSDIPGAEVLSLGRKKGDSWRAWTAADVAELRRYAAKHAPVAVVAKIMGRSEGALRMKAHALKLTLGSRMVDRSDPAEDLPRRLIDNQ